MDVTKEDEIKAAVETVTKTLEVCTQIGLVHLTRDDVSYHILGPILAVNPPAFFFSFDPVCVIPELLCFQRSLVIDPVFYILHVLFTVFLVHFCSLRGIICTAL